MSTHSAYRIPLTYPPDLYGNDEVELNEEYQEDPEALQDPAQLETTTATKPAENAPSPPPQKMVQESPKNQIPTYTSPAPQALTKPLASAYTQPTPQQIPTYEQPQPQDYRDSQHSRHQSIPASERSVRPSEMKDEG
jgi:hypothetical protein